MGPIYTDGTPRWHCLTVPPMREKAAEMWLARHGVMAFHPVRARYQTLRGHKRRIVTRYLPGYVFARFPGPVIWHELQACSFIANAIRMQSGEIASLAECDLRVLQSMADVDEAERDRREMAKRIQPGDRVRIMEGAMEGQEVEVLKLKAGRAVFSIRLFGSDMPAEAEVERLLKLG